MLSTTPPHAPWRSTERRNPLSRIATLKRSLFSNTSCRTRDYQKMTSLDQEDHAFTSCTSHTPRFSSCFINTPSFQQVFHLVADRHHAFHKSFHPFFMITVTPCSFVSDMFHLFHTLVQPRSLVV